MKIEISDKLVADYKQLSAVKEELRRAVDGNSGSDTEQHRANCRLFGKTVHDMLKLQDDIKKALVWAFREAVGDGSLK